MDIFDYAMQMEKDGEDYYREIAGSIDDPGIKKILGMLADEEVKHYEILHEMKSRTPHIGQTESLQNTKNIFAEMKESGADISANRGQVELYKKAQDLEKKSREFYEAKCAEVDSDAQKDLLLKIAEEEKRHFVILENIIQFVTRPDSYLDNAEFENIEPY